MRCELCGRDNITERELAVHTNYFHGSLRHTDQQQPQRIASGACPECGSTLWYQEGCAACSSCGYNKCG